MTAATKPSDIGLNPIFNKYPICLGRVTMPNGFRPLLVAESKDSPIQAFNEATNELVPLLIEGKPCTPDAYCALIAASNKPTHISMATKIRVLEGK